MTHSPHERNEMEWVEAHLKWAMDWYEVDELAAKHIISCDDGTATQYAFQAGAQWMESRSAPLSNDNSESALSISNNPAPKREQGEALVTCDAVEYKIWGTDGCKSCDTGRITLFVRSSECVGCQHSNPSEPKECDCEWGIRGINCFSYHPSEGD